MKGMPFFSLKNSLGSRMKKSTRTFCNGNGSNSNVNQRNSTVANSSHSQGDFPRKARFPHLQNENDNSKQSSPTLEDLILQLELEEETSGKAKLSDYGEMRGRMSCVNNSDILRSARKALNQRPRFSLDGRDAMHRSSFGNVEEGRRSVCCDRGLRGRLPEENGMEFKFDKAISLPPTLAGESVVWCKPGVVAKLMGLEAIPLPVNNKRSDSREKLRTVFRMQNLRRRF